MGGSYWSDEFYNSRSAHRAATGASAFAYDDMLRRGPPHARKTHRLMDPRHVRLRESRDSASHPESRAVAVLFDVTGSMGCIPVILQRKLGRLMALLLSRQYLAHPQVLFGAIGDATCDRAPLQVGQFESGLEMEDDLGRMFLEGGGGGQSTESYELAAYFMARHTALDCLERRGQKGYLFIIGDEQYYPAVSRRQAYHVIGDHVQERISTPAIYAELGRMYEVFHLIPRGASNSGDLRIHEAWRSLLGQNVLVLDDPAAVCETIALSIGLCEGRVDLAGGLDDLDGLGADAGARRSVSNALATVTHRH